ncbi:glycosyltransferase [Oryzomonas japonica]|uniref:Glycosyltransferase n=1 Tax=Oryzomonas japonica TaxID=2603858 RepID=A0A7J4ZTN3_9BACT|nr:glycosyltransferase [Oryzomonas japonica]KAB0666165.1 glycosyltransferase [Oryzomonas japonica]
MMTVGTGCRVSVIIPAFNSEQFLAEAITSVLSQTYINIECIVVDDGSTDSTSLVAEGFRDRIKYVHQENAERSAARNAGIAIATGDYLSFLDADDSLAVDKIVDQVYFLETHPEYGAVYSKVRFFREEGERSFFNLDRPTPTGAVLEQLLYGNFITVHSPLIRKSAVDTVIGFNRRLSHNEDWEFFLRLALSGVRFGFIDKYHAFCRMHQSNTSRDEISMHETKWQVVQQFVSEHADELHRQGIDTQQVVSYHEADFGKSLIANGRPDEGRNHIFSASRRSFPQRGKYFLFALLSYVLGQKLCARFGGGEYRTGRDEP